MAGNLIVIYGYAGEHGDFLEWSVMWCAEEDDADILLGHLRRQANDFHRRFQAWLLEPANVRHPRESSEAADAFQERMLDRNFQHMGSCKVTYHKRHIRPEPAPEVLMDLLDPDRMTPAVLLGPRCSHVGSYKNYGQGAYSDLPVRCDNGEGHAEAHEPICAEVACCAEYVSNVPTKHFTELEQARQRGPSIPIDPTPVGKVVFGKRRPGSDS